MGQFALLYNNLHFPSHLYGAACLVVPLGAVDVIPISEKIMLPQALHALISNSEINNIDKRNPYTLLPTCPVCLRRISSKRSKIEGSNQILVTAHCSYGFDSADRCLVCRIFTDSISDVCDSTSLFLLY